MSYPFKSFRDWIRFEETLGNVVRIKAPIKCGDYSDIVDIGNDIPGKQPKTEIRATLRYLHSLPGKPIGIVENPVNNRPDIPVVLNPWPTRERVLRGLGMKSKDEFSDKISRLKATKERIKPVTVSRSQAPCKEVVIREKEMDLRKDIQRNWVEFNQVLRRGTMTWASAGWDSTSGWMPIPAGHSPSTRFSTKCSPP